MEQFQRTRMLLGDGVDRLFAASVAVFGLGGVGSYAVEALARLGVGRLLLVDGDSIAKSNINRQLYALHSTLGQPKVQVAKQRVLDINPAAKVEIFPVFYGPENAELFPFSGFSCVLDAVDMVSAKLLIAERAQACGVPVISCMGTGNKLEPAMLEVADIYSTSVCPLARVMRHELRKRGVKELKVIYSREEPQKPCGGDSARVPGSVAFVPPAAGLLMAAEAIKAILAG